MSLSDNSPLPNTSIPPPPHHIEEDNAPPGLLLPTALSNPRKSSVVCFGSNTEEFPILSSLRPDPFLQGSPRPRPNPASWLLSSIADEVVDTMPNPRSNEPPEPVEPIWAAFWGNAVAEIAGWGGGRLIGVRKCGGGSCIVAPNKEELVERQRYIGFKEKSRRYLRFREEKKRLDRRWRASRQSSRRRRDLNRRLESEKRIIALEKTRGQSLSSSPNRERDAVSRTGLIQREPRNDGVGGLGLGKVIWGFFFVLYFNYN